MLLQDSQCIDKYGFGQPAWKITSFASPGRDTRRGSGDRVAIAQGPYNPVLRRCRRATFTGISMDLMALVTSPQMWLAFATLTALELVLGIDNVIFISILVDR